MQRVSFSLPLHRFEAADNMATRAALRQALGVSDNQLSDMIADALAHHQFVLNFRVTPEQFTKFLITRNDVGCGNFFAEMKPRMYDNDAPLANKRIVDFTLRSDESYRIHDDLPQSFVDRQNEKRGTRSGRWSAGSGQPHSDKAPSDFARYATAHAHTTYFPETELVTGNSRWPYDIGFKSDGTVKSRHDITVMRFPSGGVSINFRGPRASETGTRIHEAVAVAIDAANTKHSAQIVRLEAENRRLGHDVETLKKLCQNAASKLSSVLVRMKNIHIKRLDHEWVDKTSEFVKTLWSV